MFTVLVFFVVLLSVPASPLAAPTKRVVTLEAVFDSTEQRIALGSKDIHGHYSRFMELSGKGNLCPRTITHLTNGHHEKSSIALRHKDITHDEFSCHDHGMLSLKYERKLTSQAIVDIFGLDEEVTGFKRSIRKVLMSLNGFYIGVENSTRSCGRSSLAKGAAVIITSDSEPFGDEFHIPFHGHPKVMLINDRHKACAFTSTWGSPSPIAVQPAETQNSRYGPVSVTSSSTPLPSSSRTATSSTEPMKHTMNPSSTTQPSRKANDMSMTEDETPSPSQTPALHDRKPPKSDMTSSSTPPPSSSKTATSSTEPMKHTMKPSSTTHPSHKADEMSMTEDETPSPSQTPALHDRKLPKSDMTSTPSRDPPSQGQGSTPSAEMTSKTPSTTQTKTSTSEAQPLSSAAVSISPTFPKKTVEQETPKTSLQFSPKTPSITPRKLTEKPKPSQHHSPSVSQRVFNTPPTTPPSKEQSTPNASQHPLQLDNKGQLKTPSPNANLKPSSSDVSEKPLPSTQKSSTAPSTSMTQSFHPTPVVPVVFPVPVFSKTSSPAHSIYPDPSKAPKIVDFAPGGGLSLEQSGDSKGNGKKPSRPKDVALKGSKMPSEEPSKGGPLIVFGRTPTASILPSIEVSSSPLVQESAAALNDPQMTRSGGPQSPTSKPGRSSTPSPSPTADSQNNGSACFPADALAVGENGNFIRVEDLQVGSRVMVDDGHLSPVIDFSHADESIVLSFNQFVTENGRSLTVTSSHYIYTGRGLLPAREVSASDSLILPNGTAVPITAKNQVFARGLFNPHTSHGDIIIDGFKVSTYTSAIEPSIAHALMAPIRLLDKLGSRPTLVGFFVQNPFVVKWFNIRSS